MQPAGVRDFARKFAGEPERGRRHFHPTAHRVFGRRSVKCGVDLYCWKKARIKFQPARLRQIRWVKRAFPIVKAPGAGADADFLLLGQVQKESKNNRICARGKMSILLDVDLTNEGESTRVLAGWAT